jgi:hypothetical protein
MGRFKLTIEYEGTRYIGWQMQKGGKTIQGEYWMPAEVFLRMKRLMFSVQAAPMEVFMRRVRWHILVWKQILHH